MAIELRGVCSSCSELCLQFADQTRLPRPLKPPRPRSIGGSSLLNANLVVRYGMRALSTWSLRGICLASVAFTAVASAASGHPPLWMLMTYLMVSFFGIGLLFGNLNALAMQPLGRIAGTGAAVVGGTSMLISLALYLCTFFVAQGWSNAGLWTAFLVFLGSRGIGQALLYPRLAREAFAKI